MPYYIYTINNLIEFESAFEVISIGNFEFQLMTMFYYSILRLRLKFNSIIDSKYIIWYFDLLT